MKLREKSIIVLEALFNGQELEVEISVGIKHKIALIDNSLKIIALKSDGGLNNFEEVYLSCNLSINSFIDMCNRIPDKDIVVICANLTLNKINKKR
jgi:hypothetical protein